MAKDANSFTATLSQHHSDPEKIVAELCKSTDITNGGGTVQRDGDGTSHASADPKTSKKALPW